MIDFGMSKEMTDSDHPHANLHAIRHLLFDVQQGMITHGLLKVPPSILVREYETFMDSLCSSPSSVAPAEPPAASVAKVLRGVSAKLIEKRRKAAQSHRPLVSSMRVLRPRR